MENVLLQVLNQRALEKRVFPVVDPLPCITRTHPNRMNHALWSASGTGRVHDEERMVEGNLLKLQIRAQVELQAKTPVVPHPFVHAQQISQVSH